MNTKQSDIFGNRVVLLVWLAFAPLAQAYYNPSAGRWLSRDPIEESDTANLFNFCGNSGINAYDYLGKLTITPILPYEGFDCGAFAVEYAFGLNKPAPNEGGYIVQKIDRTETVTYCETGVSYTQSVSYWEVFEVFPNSTVASGTDAFGYAGPGCRPSRGSYSITGTARFYPKSKIGNLDATTPITPWLPDQSYGVQDTIPPNCLTSISAGVAPSTSVQPPFWGTLVPDEVALPRTVSVKWNCCCPTAPEYMGTIRTK